MQELSCQARQFWGIVTYMDTKLFSVAALMPVGKQVVAVSRKTNHDDFGLPGGKIDPGETPEQALTREVREETGVIVTKYQVIYEDMDRVEGGELRPCRTYLIEEWIGTPQATKENAVVTLLDPRQLMNPGNSFCHYNFKLFSHLSRTGLFRIGWEDDSAMDPDMEITRVDIPKSNPSWSSPPPPPE